MGSEELSLIVLALYEAIPIWECRLNTLDNNQEEYYQLEYQIDESRKLFSRLKGNIKELELNKPNKPKWDGESD